MKKYKPDSLTLVIICVSVFIVLVSTGYKFWWTNNYDFIVEEFCDTSTENCFHRDCLKDDSCPPNGLEDYKKYKLLASDFKKCEHDSCASICKNGIIKCEEIVCGDSPEDVCSVTKSEEIPTESE